MFVEAIYASSAAAERLESFCLSIDSQNQKLQQIKHELVLTEKHVIEATVKHEKLRLELDEEETLHGEEDKQQEDMNKGEKKNELDEIYELNETNNADYMNKEQSIHENVEQEVINEGLL